MLIMINKYEKLQSSAYIWMRSTKGIDYQELNSFSFWNKKRIQITGMKNCANSSFNREKNIALG
jgi:hypothetical protein